MTSAQTWVAPLRKTDAPLDRPHELLDVRNHGPPKPLARTLETLAESTDETVLVQLNDRAPQRLFPKLRDRGYEFVTVETDEAVVTAVWCSDGSEHSERPRHTTTHARRIPAHALTE